MNKSILKIAHVHCTYCDYFAELKTDAKDMPDDWSKCPACERNTLAIYGRVERPQKFGKPSDLAFKSKIIKKEL